MDLTPREREMLEDAENAAILRDLYHSSGWEVYCRFARQRIDNLLTEYMKDNLSAQEILDRHTRLKAVREFQVGMEGLVKGAVDFIAPANLRDMIYLSHIDPDV